jgi:hypothetical protein
MRSIFLGFLLVGAWVFLAPELPGQQAKNLTWDIQVQRGNVWELVSPRVTVEAGQTLRFAISPLSDCSCYVLSQNDERKFTVLHDQPIKGQNEIIIDPLQAGNSPGIQTLYVIMDLARQTKLEGFIRAYTKTPNEKNFNNLSKEIAKLNNSVSKLREPRLDVIQSGGSARGQALSSENITRFSERDMYVRTIRILVEPAQ